MIDNDTRLRELSSKAIEGTMSDEEFAELAQLSRAKQKLREGRAALIAGVRETLQGQGITIHELFSAAEIAAAVPTSGSLGRRVVVPRPARAAAPAGAPGSASTWVRQKSGLVLVEVNRDGANGLPCRYCKGQASPYYVSKGLKSLDDGQLEANLERCYTAAGRLYFATDEGKAELAQLVNYIRTHKLKPHLK